MDAWHTDGALHFALGFEDTFVPQERTGERALDEYALTEHYEQFDEDFSRAAAVGGKLIRWGVPWYKVQPSETEWDWTWVDQAIGSILSHGLHPIIDLLHYGTPLWLDDQFDSPYFPEAFENFARTFAARYGDRVTSYTPINEPVIHALFSGEYGYWPPYHVGSQGFAVIAVNLARAFVRAQRAVREEVGSQACFVHVEAAMAFSGDDTAPEHRSEAERLRHQVFLVEDLVTGAMNEDHPLFAQIKSSLRPGELEWFALNAATPDVMGVNYYPRHSTEVFVAGEWHGGGFADPRPVIDMGTEGLCQAIDRFAERYRAPIMVTETCVTGTYQERINWLEDSVGFLDQMRSEGANIVGYTWWPLIDMYEWTWRHSESPREDHLLTMGLYDLVETPTGLARVENPVAQVYRQLAQAHQPTQIKPLDSRTTKD